jgi:hypothetical protein
MTFFDRLNRRNVIRAGSYATAECLAAGGESGAPMQRFTSLMIALKTYGRIAKFSWTVEAARLPDARECGQAENFSNLMRKWARLSTGKRQNCRRNANQWATTTFLATEAAACLRTAVGTASEAGSVEVRQTGFPRRPNLAIPTESWGRAPYQISAVR